MRRAVETKPQRGGRGRAPNSISQLVTLLPKLRVQALALTRNRAAAEDLVQDAVANALAAQEKLHPRHQFRRLDASHPAQPLHFHFAQAA